ncbi:MAG: hypothetical protein Fur002_09510 [Anaerolineales bacterium]
MNPLPRLVLLALILLAALSACMDAPACARADVFCAGLVADTLGIDDKGVNEDAWIALQTAQRQKVIDYAAYIESIDKRDYEKNLAYFAGKKYDVVFSAGAGLSAATLRAAAQYPESIFVSINQTQDAPPANLMAMNFPEDHAGFLAGALAARMSKTGFVGAVCEKSNLPTMWRTCEGFRAGARYAVPTIKPLILYNDNVDKEKLFLDEEWGDASARSLIERGADVIFAAGGITAQAALRAALDEGVYVIGAERNQAAALRAYDLTLLASFYGDSNFAAQTLLDALRSGSPVALPAQRIRMAAPSPKIPEAVALELEALAVKLWAGALQTNVPQEKP